MSKQTIFYFIKDITYKIISPIYLWSIGYKSLDKYIADIVFDETGKYPDWYNK